MDGETGRGAQQRSNKLHKEDFNHGGLADAVGTREKQSRKRSYSSRYDSTFNLQLGRLNYRSTPKPTGHSFPPLSPR